MEEEIELSSGDDALERVDSTSRASIKASENGLMRVTTLKRSSTQFGRPDLTHNLKVTVVSGHELAARDKWSKKSDPFCVVKLGEKSFKTGVKKKNLNPRWEEEFTFKVGADLVGSLEINVFDWNRIGDSDDMGACHILLADIMKGCEDNSGKWEQEVTLDDTESGSLRIRYVLELI